MVKVLNWTIALLGLWECTDIVALFIADFGHIQAFVWNHIIVGLILVILGGWSALTRNSVTASTLDWIAAAAGAWLTLAPFILGPPAIAGGLWNDVIVGVIVIILGVWAALTARRVAG